jgi:hypothetical protein
LQSLHLPSELEEIIKGEAAQRQPSPPQRKPPGDKLPEDKPSEDKPAGDGKPDTPIPTQDNDPSDPSKLAPNTSNPEPKKDPLEGMYAQKRGFSNLFFNRWEQDRILKLQAQDGKWNETSASWKIVGQVPRENIAIDMNLSDENVLFRMEDKSDTVHPRQGWPQWIKQRSPIGIAMGMRIWQEWHRRGPRSMGDAVYLGRNPVVGREGLLDVNRITVSDFDAMVYTAPTNGQIELIEILSDNQTDPVEVYFEQYQNIDGRLTPKLVRLSYGMETKFLFSIDQFETKGTEEGKGL